MNTPVLLIGFNRPDTMQRVFSVVRQVKPCNLYFAVDGPRDCKKEEILVQQVRDIIKQVDWDCCVHTLFSELNLGCGYGPANAITWAFENEDRLIILEDDCLPSLSFFSFCDEMLERYKDDERINIVSGRSHHHGSIFFKKYDYIFTHYAHTWGWATWKRVWNEFDMLMSDFPEWIECGGSRNVLHGKAGKYSDNKLLSIFSKINLEVTHSWDSQWWYTRLKTGGLGIVPCKNLIHNIGNNGTHTKTSDDMIAEEMPKIIRHPKFIIENFEYENFHYKHFICRRDSIIFRTINKLKLLLKRYKL